MRNCFALALICTLSACASGENLKKLEAAQPTHTNFTSSLASEYLAYAQALQEQNHPMRASSIAEKGLQAASGEAPVPEEAPESKPELFAARESLMQLLTSDMKEVAPQKAASTQLYYDCWALQEKSIISNDKALCKESFADNLTELQTIGELLVHGSEGKHVIHFAPGSSTLTPEAASLLDNTAKTVNKLGQYEIQLMAYDYRKKASARTRTLAKKRMLSIEKALIARGVNAGRIREYNKRSGKEVFLSADEAGGGKNSVALTIKTFDAPKENKEP